ncbi:bifunctional non-homologous end joining protein LigD [Saccharopolyspora erythraea NRRL 2338]|uniref:ATP-dependent DNA ligase n=2 Tax=Saccharopolyspora erythraea TaxID=1836 RepID=A4FF44_SACEN|nr:non-homologous end-joining DNA ligase [Saccharopolyspora erythraea]EQD82482.1 ATP-dependent DNA ligase [Saccharopolyspora erythraea D]PFG96394.1 bifunctional non-homologous end joining protein LigD [Saccharopolyspora erythraea NRRL 2338]QRK92899.1 non-homologous end-joining DNA ligase [Saccharopolyspora erythraea]CAM02669.1 ATP-dependent DNA ligase [Saccharopolyspora erythraea NRRL 2338]
MTANSETLDIDGRSVELSKGDKVMYPDDGFTKRDVVCHYRAVAPVMLPHVRGKPLTLRRFPDGIGSGGFFQKEASEHFPDWIRVVSVPQRGADDSVHHVVADDAATLVYLANQACLEFHVALSTADDLEHPVLAVVDLDPPESTGIADLRSITKDMCDRFRDAGLDPFVQATGGKGFHVVAPLDARRDFDDVRAHMAEIADRAAQEDERLTTQQRKDKRGDRVFLDINRNAYGQTMIAPYSLRARPGAPAATPIDLAEISRATPNRHGLANMTRRLARKADPWARIDRHAAV